MLYLLYINAMENYNELDKLVNIWLEYNRIFNDVAPGFVKKNINLGVIDKLINLLDVNIMDEMKATIEKYERD